MIKWRPGNLVVQNFCQRNDGYFLENCITQVVQYKVKLYTCIYKGLKVVY